MEEEQEKAKVWEDDDEEVEEDEAAPGVTAVTKVKNITDLRPAEMARLEHRFKDINGSNGLNQEDFEAVCVVEYDMT